MRKGPVQKGYVIERVINNEHTTNWRANVRVVMDYELADKMVERAIHILDNCQLDLGLSPPEAAELALMDPHASDYDIQDLSYEISEIEVY